MKTNTAEKLVLLDEENYPDELKKFFAYIRELDAEGGPHWARVDPGGAGEVFVDPGGFSEAWWASSKAGALPAGAPGGAAQRWRH